MSLLTLDEKNRIAKAIETAESRTSGEIVVCSVAQSGRYRWIHAVAALLGGFLGTLSGALCHLQTWGSSGWSAVWNLLLWQVGGAFLLLLLVQVAALRRLLVPSAERTARVHLAALRVFVESGVLNTRDRTGVLIYVSEFEHRVEILADQGIHSVVGNTYWQDQVQGIVAGIRAQKAADAICAAVGEIGARLAEKFPPRNDDTNELPNQPI